MQSRYKSFHALTSYLKKVSPDECLEMKSKFLSLAYEVLGDLLSAFSALALVA